MICVRVRSAQNNVNKMLMKNSKLTRGYFPVNLSVKTICKNILNLGKPPLNHRDITRQQSVYFSQSFLLFIRPVMFISFICLLAIWSTETYLQQISSFNKFCYPLLTLFLATNLIYSYRSKTNIEVVTCLFFILFMTYFVVDYYYIFIYLEVIGESSHYNLSSLSQWLPIAYIGAFLFLKKYNALKFSLVFALCLFLPELLCFDNVYNHSPIAHSLTLNLMLSHPVYICLLWGVSHLKMMSYHDRNNANLMYKLSKIDSLTKVSNRRGINESLRKMLSEYKRGSTQFSVVLFDIDHFKSINDQFGHLAGDEVLIAIADSIKSELRLFDELGRWGGEEFIAILRHNNYHLVSEITERLRIAISSLCFESIPQKITASFGVVHCKAEISEKNDQKAIELLIAQADKALYKAKNTGRNKVVIA